MEGYDKKEGFERHDREEIFSNAVRAGKRTYFFDVKATRKNDYYLTITESKKRLEKDGRFSFEKHKIFLYKEDFDKFADGLLEAIQYIKANNKYQEEDFDHHTSPVITEDIKTETFTNVEFEDLSE